MENLNRIKFFFSCLSQVFSLAWTFEILFLHFVMCVLLLDAFALITTFYISTSTGKSNTTNINNQIKFLFSRFSRFLAFVCIYIFRYFLLVLLLLLSLLLADFGWYINIVCHFFASFFLSFFLPFIFVNRRFHWRSTKFGVNKTHSVGYHGSHDWWITSRCHCNLLQFPFSLSHDYHRST